MRQTHILKWALGGGCLIAATGIATHLIPGQILAQDVAPVTKKAEVKEAPPPLPPMIRGVTPPKPVPVPANEARPSPAPKADDNINQLLNVLKQSGNAEAAKQIEELIRQFPQLKDIPPLPVVPQAPPQRAPQGNMDPARRMEQMRLDMMRRQADMMKQMMDGLGAGFGGIDGGIVPPPNFARVPQAAPAVGSGRMGIRVERPSDVLASQLELPNGQGLVCAEVFPDSVCGKAGMKQHDILLELNGKPVSNEYAEFMKSLTEVKPDQAVDIVVMRKGRKETLKGVKLPEGQPMAAPGSPVLRSRPAPVQNLPFQDGPMVPPPPFNPGFPAGNGESVRVERVNDAFTVFYSKNGVSVTVTGETFEGKPKIENIEVIDNGKSFKSNVVEKLPKDYQPLAEKAIQSIK